MPPTKVCLINPNLNDIQKIISFIANNNDTYLNVCLVYPFTSPSISFKGMILNKLRMKRLRSLSTLCIAVQPTFHFVIVK